MILHTVGQSQADTRVLHFREGATFLVLYHAVNPSGATPSATLLITKNGKSVGRYAMTSASYQGHPAFTRHLGLVNKAMAGKLYAHFRLALDTATAKRDRRFYVLPTR